MLKPEPTSIERLVNDLKEKNSMTISLDIGKR